jgi:hypothetical protein
LKRRRLVEVRVAAFSKAATIVPLEKGEAVKGLVEVCGWPSAACQQRRQVADSPEGTVLGVPVIREEAAPSSGPALSFRQHVAAESRSKLAQNVSIFGHICLQGRHTDCGGSGLPEELVRDPIPIRNTAQLRFPGLKHQAR